MENYRTTGGNLVAGDGYLIVAQPDAVVVFCQNSRLIERYRDEIARNPEQAATHYRLARAAEAVGRDQLALESYDQATRRARSTETIDGVPLAEASRDHQFRLLLRVVAAARGEKKFEEAISGLETASRVARSDGDRLKARLMLAEIQIQADRPTTAIAILEQALSEDRLRGLTVSTEDGHRAIRADLLIADRLWEIVKQRGRSIYAASDRKARELFDRGRREQDPRAPSKISAGPSRWPRSCPRHCWNSVIFIRSRAAGRRHPGVQEVARPRGGFRFHAPPGTVETRSRLRGVELPGIGPRRLPADPGPLSRGSSCRN